MKTQIRIFVALFVLVFLLSLFSFNKNNAKNGQVGFLQQMIVSVYQPLVSGFKSASDFFADFFDDYLLLVHTKKENKALLDLVHVLRMQNRTLKQALNDKTESEKIQSQYHFLNRPMIKVDVLAFDLFLPTKTIWIAAGKKQGVLVNQPVVSGKGLVGRVIQVFDDSSQVLLAIDSNFSVDVLNERTGLRVLVKGLRSGRYESTRLPFLSQVEYYEKGQEMKMGDSLITSGINGIYPKGISVGQVTKVHADDLGYFDNSVVLPSVDFTKLDSVYVMFHSTKAKSP